MIKKIYNICFIAIFMSIMLVPIVFADWSSGGVSEDENRNLAPMPEIFVNGSFNDNYTSEYETWFMDHMGMRDELISFNARIQYAVFERMLETSNFYLGRNGDLNYATDEMIIDYAHLNLRSDEDVKKIGESYQTISDWLEQKNIQFYYVQCWDKHSIYPEQFMSSVNQIGNISKTDQVISYLRDNTTVNTISLKEVLIKSKGEYEVYSNWGDPTHWSPRGSKIGYRFIMDKINYNNGNKFNVLNENDYDITISDLGVTRNNVIHEVDMLESFFIKKPQAVRIDGIDVLGGYSADARNQVWKNESVNNDTRVLLVCDSYLGNYIVQDLAESFSELVLIWADYGAHLPNMVESINPDIVIFECAERADRSHIINEVAEKIR